MTEKRYVRDVIHSFISFEKKGLINQLIDTPEFQRLRYIRQLGLSYFTYPNATHTRFPHSLGTYWISVRLSQLLEDSISKEDQEIFTAAALLHDIGHGPFSHVFEKFFASSKHEEISKNVIEKTQISEVLDDNSIEPTKITKILRSGYLNKLVSSQLDVDRLDYLLRDSVMSGNPHGGYDIERIIYTIKFNDKSKDAWVEDGGWNAVEHYLTCRYQMYKQVYYHHTTLAAEELLKKILLRIRKLHQDKELKLSKKSSLLVRNDLSYLELLDIADFDIFSINDYFSLRILFASSSVINFGGSGFLISK